MDYMIRAVAADDSIRAFAASTRDMAEYARDAHRMTPVCTAALGRLLTGGVMMGSMMKEDKGVLTIQVSGDGPIGGITVTADSRGHAKGYVNHPGVELPLKSNGHLDVSGAVGHGNLTVIRDLGLKEPYVGTIQMPSGELAEDLTYYFAESEQIPSAVGLGVLVDTDLSVKEAGGFIIQIMPQTPDNVITELENKLRALPSVTDMLEEGLSPEGILNKVLGDMGVRVEEKTPVSFRCGCSRERIGHVLATLQMSDLDELIREDKPVDIACNFCGKSYHYDVDELKKIRAARRTEAAGREKMERRSAQKKQDGIRGQI